MVLPKKKTLPGLDCPCYLNDTASLVSVDPPPESLPPLKQKENERKVMNANSDYDSLDLVPNSSSNGEQSKTPANHENWENKTSSNLAQMRISDYGFNKGWEVNKFQAYGRNFKDKLNQYWEIPVDDTKQIQEIALIQTSRKPILNGNTPTTTKILVIDLNYKCKSSHFRLLDQNGSKSGKLTKTDHFGCDCCIEIPNENGNNLVLSTRSTVSIEIPH